MENNKTLSDKIYKSLYGESQEYDVIKELLNKLEELK